MRCIDWFSHELRLLWGGISSRPSCLRGTNGASDIYGFSVYHGLCDLIHDPLSLDYGRLLAYFVLEVAARATSLLGHWSVILGPLKCHLEWGQNLSRRREVLERLSSNHCRCGVQFLFTTCNWIGCALWAVNKAVLSQVVASLLLLELVHGAVDDWGSLWLHGRLVVKVKRAAVRDMVFGGPDIFDSVALWKKILLDISWDAFLVVNHIWQHVQGRVFFDWVHVEARGLFYFWLHSLTTAVAQATSE